MFTIIIEVEMMILIISMVFFFFQFYVSPKLCGISLMIVPPIMVMSLLYGRYVKKITKSVQDALAESTQVNEF